MKRSSIFANVFFYFIFVFCIGIISLLFCMIYLQYAKKNVTGQEQVEVEYIETIRYATEKEQIEHDIEEIEIIAKLIYGEARGCSTTEQAAVIWCVLNRMDSTNFPDNVIDVITQKNQFSGYNENNPVYQEYVDLAEDVMTRYVFEKTAIGDIGRVLPREYMWFRGNGEENIFRDSYKGAYNIWDWSLESPYRE